MIAIESDVDGEVDVRKLLNDNQFARCWIVSPGYVLPLVMSLDPPPERISVLLVCLGNICRSPMVRPNLLRTLGF